MSGRGLFLDLDGTLADSLGALKSVYRAFLVRFDASPSEEEFDRLNGPPLARVVALLKEAHGIAGTHSELMTLYAGMVREAQSNVLPASGAHELLHRARDQGWQTCVVTSSPSALARAWLDRNGLLDAITATVGGDEVSIGKPSPEPYRLAIARTSSDPSRSLAVEDSPAGAASAVAAGLPTLALGSRERGGNWPAGVAFIGSLHEVAARLS